MILRNGGIGVNLRRDVDAPNTPPNDIAITEGNLGVKPGGANGRIALAVPALVPNNPLENTLLEGWLYVTVINGPLTSGGALQGLYVTKDFGANWTQIKIPHNGTKAAQVPSNNYNLTDYSVFAGPPFGQGWYDITFAVDPNNPSILYMGGSADGDPFGFIRIDTTGLLDTWAETPWSNNLPDGGLQQFATTGGINVKNAATTGTAYGLTDDTSAWPNAANMFTMPVSPQGILNQLRDPTAPFVTSAMQYTNVSGFNNTGTGATWTGFSNGLVHTDQHALVALRDPQTGKTRLFAGDDQAVWTGLDTGNGGDLVNIGSLPLASGNRTNNLQVMQLYQGAAQPSVLAANLAGAQFYGMAQDDGFPVAQPNVLDAGNINTGYSGSPGDGTGVAVDQTGGGTAYFFKFPCCGSSPLASDFLSVTSPTVAGGSRTTGLILLPDNPATGAGEWPFVGGFNIGLNPIDPSAALVSSSNGNVFMTSGPAPPGGTGYGGQWFLIADPAAGDKDATNAEALAFGAPAAPGNVAPR